MRKKNFIAYQDEWVKMHRDGFTFKEIGYTYNCAITTIRRYVRLEVPVRIVRNDLDLFFAQFNENNCTGCIEWTGRKTTKGYGIFYLFGQEWFTHRLSYILCFGDLPEHLYVCHHCDNPLCGNPAHLFLGTALDNMVDMYKKGRGNGALNKELVRMIRAEFYINKRSVVDISKQINIKRGTVWNAVQYKTWAHIS